MMADLGIQGINIRIKEIAQYQVELHALPFGLCCAVRQHADRKDSSANSWNHCESGADIFTNQHEIHLILSNYEEGIIKIVSKPTSYGKCSGWKK